MSIKTTHCVTRDFAIKAILMKQSSIYSLSDSELEDLLEDTLHNGFYNFRIVDEEEFENNKKEEYPSPYLDDLGNLPERNDAW